MRKYYVMLMFRLHCDELVGCWLFCTLTNTQFVFCVDFCDLPNSFIELNSFVEKVTADTSHMTLTLTKYILVRKELSSNEDSDGYVRNQSLTTARCCSQT